jgi:hypothetical protein
MCAGAQDLSHQHDYHKSLGFTRESRPMQYCKQLCQHRRQGNYVTTAGVAHLESTYAACRESEDPCQLDTHCTGQSADCPTVIKLPDGQRCPWKPRYAFLSASRAAGCRTQQTPQKNDSTPPSLRPRCSTCSGCTTVCTYTTTATMGGTRNGGWHAF